MRGKVIKGVGTELVKSFGSSYPLELCSDHFSGQPCLAGGVNKDLNDLLHGATPPLSYQNEI